MDAETFDHNFKKIRAKWKSAFTDDMALQVYNIVKDVPVDEFSKWVDGALWFPQPPDRNSFHGLAKNFRRNFSIVKEDSECPECDGKGNMSVNDSENYQHWFACISCEDGQRIHRDLPRWKPGWLRHGWKINRRHTWKEAT
jgi:hypothetical protein